MISNSLFENSIAENVRKMWITYFLLEIFIFN